MSAKTMRSFAGGLLVAASILSAVYFFGPSPAQTAGKLSTAEMKSLLTSEGYVIHTKEEWNEQLAAVDAAEKKAEEAGKANEAKAKDTAKEQTGEEKVVYRMMLSVASGMTSIEVGQALESAKIIPSGREFSSTVESRGLANALRPGMYEIQSGMSVDEIIGAIFK
jgi:hypothetical protein